MRDESLDLKSFEVQKKNKWKIKGKTFFDLFKSCGEPEDFYILWYGMSSESIHGSWNESLDFDLQKKEDGIYGPYPFYQPVDIRFITPILRFCHDPYLLWLKRIECEDESITKIFFYILFFTRERFCSIKWRL